MKEKTQVEDIDRSIYDIKDKENDAYRMEAGLTPEIIETLSKEKGDPEWMREFRLKSQLGAFDRGTGHGSYRDLCQTQDRHEERLEGRSAGYKGHL